MRKVGRIAGTAAPMPRADIDTDAIIPQRWLITTDREGLGTGLFGNWRYRDARLTPEPDFVLNQPRFAEARIIVAGPNYGCGSSREHAVWAHLDYGVEAVIAASFGPIFRDNALRNGLLTITLDERLVADLLAQLSGAARPSMAVDLEKREVVAPDRTVHAFAIDESVRRALLAGQDAIAATLEHAGAIEAFRSRDQDMHPFFWNVAG